jgi:hypothetical protein
MSNRIEVELPDHVMTALQQWIAREPTPRPTVESAIVLGVCEWLSAQGMLPAEACSDDEKAA